MDGCTDVLVSIRLKGCGCGREVQGTQIGPRSALPCASDIFPGGDALTADQQVCTFWSQGHSDFLDGPRSAKG